MTASKAGGPTRDNLVPDDPIRDAHLMTALRHAPDRDLGPPPALSQTIVEAARAAARCKPLPMRPGRGWRRLLDLALPSPAWGGAMAAVAAASITMWLWSGHEVPAPIEPKLGAPAAAVNAPLSPPEAPAPAVAAGPALAAVPAQSKPSAANRLKAREVAGARSSPPAVFDAAGRDRQASTRPADTGRQAAANSGSPVPAETTPAATQPVRVAEPSESAPEAIEQTAAKAVLDPSAVAASVRTQGSEARLAEATAPASPSGIGTRAAPSQPTSPVQALITGSAGPDSVWRWQRVDTQDTSPLDAEGRTWLQRLDAATRGRWVASKASTLASPAWRWWQGDRLAASMRIEADGLRFTDADGRAWFAAMSATEIDALR